MSPRGRRYAVARRHPPDRAGHPVAALHDVVDVIERCDELPGRVGVGDAERVELHGRDVGAVGDGQGEGVVPEVRAHRRAGGCLVGQPGCGGEARVRTPVHPVHEGAGPQDAAGHRDRPCRSAHARSAPQRHDPDARQHRGRRQRREGVAHRGHEPGQLQRGQQDDPPDHQPFGRWSAPPPAPEDGPQAGERQEGRGEAEAEAHHVPEGLEERDPIGPLDVGREVEPGLDLAEVAQRAPPPRVDGQHAVERVGLEQAEGHEGGGDHHPEVGGQGPHGAQRRGDGGAAAGHRWQPPRQERRGHGDGGDGQPADLARAGGTGGDAPGREDGAPPPLRHVDRGDQGQGAGQREEGVDHEEVGVLDAAHAGGVDRGGGDTGAAAPQDAAQLEDGEDGGEVGERGEEPSDAVDARAGIEGGVAVGVEQIGAQGVGDPDHGARRLVPLDGAVVEPPGHRLGEQEGCRAVDRGVPGVGGVQLRRLGVQVAARRWDLDRVGDEHQEPFVGVEVLASIPVGAGEPQPPRGEHDEDEEPGGGEPRQLGRGRWSLVAVHRGGGYDSRAAAVGAVGAPAASTCEVGA